MGKRSKPAQKENRRSIQPKLSFSEWGTITKTGKGLINAALVYPNTYKAGMSNLGFQTVYRLINQIETVFCQRVFLPDKKKRPPRQNRSPEH
jgi:hypothetical protein